MEYLDFELPLKDLNDQLENCKKLGNLGKVDVKDTLQEIKSKLLSKKKKFIVHCLLGKEFSFLDTHRGLIHLTT